MVHISYPILAESEETALRLVEYAKHGYHGTICGTFLRQRRFNGKDIFLNKFQSSLTASHAKIDNFTVQLVEVSTDEIMGSVQNYILEIDVFLIPRCLHMEFENDVLKQANELEHAANDPSVVSSIAQNLKAAVEQVKHKVLEPDVGELASNKLIWEQIAQVARRDGYTVETVFPRMEVQRDFLCTMHQDQIWSYTTAPD